MRLGRGWALLSLLGACNSSRSAPPVPSAARSVAPAPSVAAPANAAVPRASSVASSGEKESAPASTLSLLESAKIVKLGGEPKGRLVAELENLRPRVQLMLATKEAPLGPREVVAYFRIAEQVAPGLAAPTAFR